MIIRLAAILLMLWSPLLASAQKWQERADWMDLFRAADVLGTIAVVDGRTHQYLVYNRDRSKARFPPASTFKIPHTLFALDAGIVKDEFQVFIWDGVERQFPAWNRDQDLRSALRSSTLWVYQTLARQLGEKREQEYLRRIAYGNADTSGGINRFWLDGGLRISAQEQIGFLQKLYNNTLPFPDEHQRLVKDLMIVETGRNWALHAKSGWASDVEPQIGWYVGWLERPEGPVFFALNMDMPGKAKDLDKREALVRAVLRSLQVLPAD